MSLIQKSLFLVLTLGLAIGFIVGTPRFAYATCPPGADKTDTDKYVELSIAVEDVDGDGKITDADRCVAKGSSINDNPIIVYLKGIINFLAAGVGIVTVISIVISGIQYMTSQGNPQSLNSAKNRLFNAIVALLLFIFMYAVLNFVIPGRLI